MKLFRYKDVQANVHMLLWAACYSDAIDRVLMHFVSKGLNASLYDRMDIQKCITLVKVKPGVIEEFKRTL